MSTATNADAAALEQLLSSNQPVTLLVGEGLAAATGIERPVGERTDPAQPWTYWRPRMQRIFDTLPQDPHFRLRRWAENTRVAAVLTDSDDWLVAESGVETIELARSVAQSICPDCGYTEPLGCLLSMAPIPVCAACGATLEPGPIVPPSEETMQAARDALASSRSLLAIGSAMTDPAVALLVTEFLDRGGRLAIANDTETTFDGRASWHSTDILGTIADLG